MRQVVDRERQLVRGCDQLGMGWSSEAGKMFAFLSIFHPEMTLEQRLELAHDLSGRMYIPVGVFCATMKEMLKRRGELNED